MIPKFIDEDYQPNYNIEIIEAPSYTHKMHIDEERVYGHVEDEVEAVKQMIYKCINTEKDIFPIYRQFGVKKRDLFGKRKGYAFAVLTLRIEDALMLDDRIKSVTNFVYHPEWSDEDNLGMSFTVKTIFEDKEIPIKEVMDLGQRI